MPSDRHGEGKTGLDLTLRRKIVKLPQREKSKRKGNLEKQRPAEIANGKTTTQAKPQSSVD